MVGVKGQDACAVILLGKAHALLSYFVKVLMHIMTFTSSEFDAPILFEETILFDLQNVLVNFVVKREKVRAYLLNLGLASNEFLV